MQVYMKIIFTLCLSNLVTALLEPENYKLEQLQVLFRHGDRTPSLSEIYETDPYDHIYQTYGYGQLTKTGKQREYKIGQFLRKRYGAFLGEYRGDDVYAHSSDSYRTKMSLLLVLAGLYPPSQSTSWSDSINWQPIPTHDDALNVGFLGTNKCPESFKVFQESQEDPEILDILQKYQPLYQRIKDNTNVTITSLSATIPFYNNLHCSRSMGLRLPHWCSEQDFRELQKITVMAFKTLTRTEKLRRMMAGSLVEQFLKTLIAEESSKKVYLYSGHDMNLAIFVHAHNITNIPDYPDFGSAIIMEKLRGSDDQSYIRLYLRTGVSEELLPLKLDNCERVCPLSDYKKIVQPILPEKTSRICPSSKVLCRQRMITMENIDWDTELSYFYAGSDLASFKYMKDFLPFTVEKS